MKERHRYQVGRVFISSRLRSADSQFFQKHLTVQICIFKSCSSLLPREKYCTGLGKRVGPGLRELARGSQEVGFTQPRTQSIIQPSTINRRVVAYSCSLSAIFTFKRFELPQKALPNTWVREWRESHSQVLMFRFLSSQIQSEKST